MGIYDTVMVPCPNCGELTEAQSKSGDCLLRVFDFDNCPEDVMLNVNRHAPFECFSCKTIFEVQHSPELKVVETEVKESDFPEIPEDADLNDFLDAFETYVNKISSK